MIHGDYKHDYARLAEIAASNPLPVPAKKLLIAGDTHGDMQHFDWLLHYAHNRGINTIVQLGDFGYWPHLAKDNTALARLNERARKLGIYLLWICGNHENYTALWMDRPTVPDTPFHVIDTNIFYIPRGSVWSWHGRRMLGLGGAVSIDIAWRREAEKRRKKKHQRRNWYWWPEEALTTADMDAAIANLNGDTVDIMFTHEAPTSANIGTYLPYMNIDTSPAMMESRDIIQRVMNQARPAMLFHGHYHARYSGEGGGFDYVTRVEGLGANVGGNRHNAGTQNAWAKGFPWSVAVLNLDNLTIESGEEK